MVYSIIMWKKKLVIQSCPTFCEHIVCSLPGSSVHGSSQARKLEWVAIPFSRGSSWPRDRTQASCIKGRLFTVWATRDALMTFTLLLNVKVREINTYTLNKTVKIKQIHRVFNLIKYTTKYISQCKWMGKFLKITVYQWYIYIYIYIHTHTMSYPQT